MCLAVRYRRRLRKPAISASGAARSTMLPRPVRADTFADGALHPPPEGSGVGVGDGAAAAATAVAVCGRLVAVGVGGTRVAVGGTGVAVGGIGVAVGGIGVAVGLGVAVGGGVGVGGGGVGVGVGKLTKIRLTVLNSPGWKMAGGAGGEDGNPLRKKATG